MENENPINLDSESDNFVGNCFQFLILAEHEQTRFIGAPQRGTRFVIRALLALRSGFS